MGTIVTIHVVEEGSEASIERAFEWFHDVERRCSRFRNDSELMQLRPGETREVSELLFEAVEFALEVARETEGAFDPAIGHKMEARGFDREHKSGERIQHHTGDADATWRDVAIDREKRAVTLQRPLTLDLGAVAKGMAVDRAASELKAHRDFAIDAGGDLYLGGVNPKGKAWTIGIRHPLEDGAVIEHLRVTDAAVCTSGDYERGEHILDPRGESGSGRHRISSATVVAASAMRADALATAAFVLGPEEGIRLLERMKVEGLLFTKELDRYETRGLPRAA